MNVIYLNDNSTLCHVGCRAVTDAHDRIFGELRFSVVLRLFKNDLFIANDSGDPEMAANQMRRAYGDVIRRADAVIANGEGTLHHGRGRDILAFLVLAQSLGKRTYLINSLVQDLRVGADVIGRCAGVAVRDPISLREAKTYHAGTVLIPDSIGYARFEPFESRRLERTIVVTDSLGKGAGDARKIIDRFLAESDTGVSYFPLQNPVNAALWRHAVNYFTVARCVVSGRHHGCYLAALAGRPFVALESNSHKMAALRQYFGDFVPLVTRYEELPGAIEMACDHAIDFAGLRERLLQTGYGEEYARLFEVGGYGAGSAGARVAVCGAPPVATDNWGRGPSNHWMRRAARWLRDARPRRDVGGVASPELLGDGTGISTEELAARGTTLLGIESHGESRLKSLRAVLGTLSRQSNTYRRHNEFWTAFLAACRRKPYLLSELEACADDAPDRRLRDRVRVEAARQRSSAERLFSRTLREFRRNPGVGSAVAHLKCSVCLGVSSDIEWAVGFLAGGGEAGWGALFEALVPALSQARRYRDVVAACDVWRPHLTNEQTLLKVADCYDRLGRHDAATEFLQKVERDQGLKAIARIRMGRVLIRKSSYSRGWELLEATRERPAWKKAAERSGLVEWDGVDRGVRGLLIWISEAEGLGGEILQSRVVPEVPRIFRGSIGLAADPRLGAVFRRSFPGVEVHDRDAFGAQERLRYDRFVLSRSLMGRAIHSDQDFRRLSRFRLEVGGCSAVIERCLCGAPARPNVAVSWMTTNTESGAARNVPPDLLGECLARHECNYFAIQHGDATESVQVLRSVLGERFFPDVVDPRGSVEEIGRALRRMDAVITIDNSLLHMAGGFGVRCFGLLPRPCTWTWPLSGSWGRWYDSVELLRQVTPGHWADPLGELDGSLARLTAAIGRARPR